MSDASAADRVERLLDAIELVKNSQRKEAMPLLRSIIHEDSNSEDAWLWMSVAVDSLDQSIVCLDNVLRINPNNWQAAGALHRLRESEMVMEKRRSQLRFYRDLSYVGMMVITMMWIFTLAIM